MEDGLRRRRGGGGGGGRMSKEKTVGSGEVTQQNQSKIWSISIPLTVPRIACHFQARTWTLFQYQIVMEPSSSIRALNLIKQLKNLDQRYSPSGVHRLGTYWPCLLARQWNHLPTVAKAKDTCLASAVSRIVLIYFAMKALPMLQCPVRSLGLKQHRRD